MDNSASTQIQNLRNIAIIAHVDHGKTTLVDELLKQSGTLDDHKAAGERMMDSNAIEKERGITILAKNTAIRWHDNRGDENYRINIVDTPGHADFGGEVERILSMVDAVLLLVDAVDGPMPQTRFVAQKAFSAGLNPIVVINKIDREGARPDWVIDQIFDLFDALGANDTQLDFPVVYASAIQGISGLDDQNLGSDMTALFETIVDKVQAPDVDLDGPLQMQVSALDYSSYLGAIAVGRVKRGTIKRNQEVSVIDREGKTRQAKVGKIFSYLGLDRVEVESAAAGDIIAITGIQAPKISETLCDPQNIENLPSLTVDEPTMSMTFQVNDSPFAGRVGDFVTSRHLADRLERELIHNVALRVEPTEFADRFKVSGRGELHLSILIENMRREGYELSVSRPSVIIKEIDGELHEPYEELTIDIEQTCQGKVMERIGERRGILKDMIPTGDRVRLDYVIPSRGLIGFQTEFLTLTAGSGLMYHNFSHYDVQVDGAIGQRHNGVLISGNTGEALGYALFNLQNRGHLMIGHGEAVYEGMVIGLHSRDNDLTVNPLKAKQLTNIRAAGTDENIILTPPLNLSLEQALTFINDDELVEITPESIRVRKKHLTENARKRASRG